MIHFSSPKSKSIKKTVFCELLEIRRTRISLSKNMRFEYYLTQPKSMLQWKLLAKLEKILKLYVYLIIFVVLIL